MARVIVIEPEELAQLVEAAVRRALGGTAFTGDGVKYETRTTAASRTGLSVKSLDRAIADGRLTRYGSNRRVLLRVDQVDALLAAGGRKGGPDLHAIASSTLPRRAS